MKEKLYAFMSGRYGVDEFNRFLMISAFVLILLNGFTGIRLFYLVGLAMWVYECFRMLSRDYYRRSAENTAYLRVSRILKHHGQCVYNSIKDKNYSYFTCPSCGKMVRVPKGRGKITITCPTCHREFDRKS